MKWPWQPPEARSFTDTSIADIEAAATDATADAASAALETAAGFLARELAAVGLDETL